MSYVPLSLPEACVLVENGRLAFDAAMVATSLPDAQGQVSFGTAVGMTDRVGIAISGDVPRAIAEQVAGNARSPALASRSDPGAGADCGQLR